MTKDPGGALPFRALLESLSLSLQPHAELSSVSFSITLDAIFSSGSGKKKKKGDLKREPV